MDEFNLYYFFEAAIIGVIVGIVISYISKWSDK